MLKVITTKAEAPAGETPAIGATLDDLARDGARRMIAAALTAKSYVEIDKPVYDPAKRQRTLVRMRRPVRHCPTCKRTEQEFHQRGKHAHLYQTKDLIEQMKVHVPEARRRGY